MEYYILFFLPISEWVSLLVILLSFLLPRSSLNLHFPQTRTSWTQISYTASWNSAVGEFTFPFFSSTETRNLALGVTLSHCWQRSTAGWHLPSATAELEYSVPSSKLCIKQTKNQQTKSLPRILQKQFEAEVNWRKFNLFFSHSSIRKKFASSITWIVPWALHRLVWIAMWKMSGSDSVRSNCGLQHSSRQRILGGTLV